MRSRKDPAGGPPRRHGDGVSDSPLLPVRLRVRTDADAGFLRHLYGEARAAELAAAPWPDDMKMAFLDDQFRIQDRHYATRFPDAAFQIVEANCRPIGRLYVDWGAQAVHMIDITLSAAVRGRGIGTGLLRDVITQAGARPVTLQVVDGNPAARLYARLGFLLDGPQETFYRCLRREGALPHPGLTAGQDPATLP